jgi:hypothetical protein
MARSFFALFSSFLVGMLAGVLAMGSWGSAPDGAYPPELASGHPAAETSQPLNGAAQGAALAKPAPANPAPGTGQVPEEDDADGDRLRVLTAAWAGIQDELRQLKGRVSGLEQRLAASSSAGEPTRPDRPANEEERRARLLEAGVASELAAEIVGREAKNELDRLELRDVALREGWFGSDRYREELGRLEAQEPDLRAEIGDEAYDRYLYAAGADNRVRIGSVIPGSAAEEAGLAAGDLIEAYDDGRIFTFAGLQDATSEGERGDLVPVDIKRQDGSRLQAWLPRGPLGVRLDRTRADPDA